jgi:energy-coupling factor transporter ATP-binding protein EcfA2
LDLQTERRPKSNPLSSLSCERQLQKMEDLTDPTQQSIGKSLGNDLYKAGRKWLQALDANGDKLSDYQEGIHIACGQIKVMGMATPRRLDRLYIALKAYKYQRKLSQKPEVYSTGKVNEITSDIARKLLSASNSYDIDAAIAEIGYQRFFPTRSPESGGDIPRRRVKSAECANEVCSFHGVDAMHLVAKNDALLVLGQPGCGKTTFLKYLALAYAGLVQSNASIISLLPVYVPLREYSRVDDPKPSADWLLSLVKNCAREVGGVKFQDAWLESFLNSGKCLILLDGIDEVPLGVLTPIVRSINAFSLAHRKNKIVATCRVAAFEFALDGFNICEADDFSFDDACQFIGHWFEDDSRTKSDLIGHLKANGSTNDLTKTPLLLTLLCVMYEFSRSLPENRAELYEACIDALLYRWDAYRGVDREAIVSLTPPRKKLILSQIAEYTFSRDSFYFSRQALLSLLATQLERSSLAEIDPQDALRELEQNNGILVERAIDIFSFSHLTLHEFFAASAYCSERKEMELVGKVIVDSRYREVFLLVLEMLYSADQVIIELCRRIKAQFVDAGTPSVYLHDLLLTIRRSHAAMNPKLRKVLSFLANDLDTGGPDYDTEAGNKHVKEPFEDLDFGD